MIDARPEPPIVSVSRLATFVQKIFDEKREFRMFGVRGEITNYKAQPLANGNGNVYFDLKDRDALLNCVAFGVNAASFPALSNGDAVVAYGSLTTYKLKSNYQLKVVRVAADGASGALHARYEALKARLLAEGLFAAERKRPLPRFPFRIALITSRKAEGARDFLTQARSRAPHVDVRVIDTAVQGENAAPEIVRAIVRAGAMRDVDLVVLARGGGSMEDLFAFSDERVVRALAACPLPTVSAIGHEVDSPLTDFVADRRAATPSEAAQTILPRRADLLAQLSEIRRVLVRDVDRAVTTRQQRLDGLRRGLDAATRRRAGILRERLTHAERRLAAVAPAARLAQRRARFGELRSRLLRSAGLGMQRRAERLRTVAARLERAQPGVRLARAQSVCVSAGARLDAAFRSVIERQASRLRLAEAQLAGNNPEAILQRGYAIVTDESGRALRDADDVAPGTRIVAQLARGRLAARVEAQGRDGGRQIGLF